MDKFIKNRDKNICNDNKQNIAYEKMNKKKKKINIDC